MQKIGSRIAALIGIFILAAAVFFVLAGEEGTVSETQEMSEATFPVLFFTCGGQTVNGTFGHTQQVDGSTIRDTVTPVADDLTIPVTIDAYENEIISVAYNVYSADGQTLLEEHTAVSVETEDGQVQTSVILYDEIDSGEDAVLEVILDVSDGDALYYYTRLTMQEEIPLTLGISFAKTFHEETLSGSDGSSISAYLETSSDTEYTTLDHVTIESSLSLVMWGSLSPVLASELYVDIAEANESYQAFTLTYLVSSAQTGATYYVEEYFRVRISSSRAYLLDYDRTAEQIFTAADGAVSESSLNLGIRDEDVVYLTDESGSAAAFVQNGQLWEYDASDGELIRVYGYLDTDADGSIDTDIRDLNTDHEIRILSMDESGNLYFLVCGYQNRGAREGADGLSLFYFDAINRTVEEILFLQSDSASQILAAETDGLSYVNADGALFLLYDGTLYEISPDPLEITVIDSGIDASSCITSDGGRYAVYTYAGERDCAQALTVADLKTGELTTISGDGNYVRALGFLGENLIYGIAEPDDLATDETGDVIFAMNTLVILDTDLNVIKQYDEGNYYVTDAEVEDGLVRLTRVTKSGSGYEEADDDTILDYDNLGSTVVSIGTSAIDGTEETQVTLDLTVSAADEITLRIPETAVTDGAQETTLLTAKERVHAWRVYRKQDLVYAGDSLYEAVTLADETAAVVTDASGTLVWRRNNDSSGSISDLEAQSGQPDSWSAALAAVLLADGASEDAVEEALDSFETAQEVVEAVLPDAVFMDLTGCTLDEALWFTAQGRPVMTLFEGTTVIIQSYSSTTVTIFYPRTGATSIYTTAYLENRLESAGNVFYTWVD